MITTERKKGPIEGLIDYLSARIDDYKTRKNFNFLRNANLIGCPYWQYFLSEKLLKDRRD